MGSRRNTGGIRKKKSKRKDPNHQRLQKSVEKSSAREAREQKRIDSFRAKYDKLAPQVQPPRDVGATPKHVSSRETFGELMRLIAPNAELPDEAAPSSPPKRPRPPPAAAAAERSAAVPPPVTEEAAEATASSRTLAHFGLDSAAVQSKEVQVLGAPVDMPHVGRLRATFDVQLDDALPVDIRALSLQPTLERAWRTLPAPQLNSLASATLLALRDFRDVALLRRVPPACDMQLRRLAVAHALSHVLRCRAQLKRHDGAKEAVRDQGFSRPRVLFLVPMRNAAYEVVRCITQLCTGASGSEPLKSVAHRNRFEKEFGPPDGDETFDVDKHRLPEHSAQVNTEGYDLGRRAKPVDYQHLMRGNTDDDFKIGIQLWRKEVKLYTDFYDSDIIVASPIALQRNQAAKADGFQAPAKRKAEAEEWKSGLSAEKNRKRQVLDDDDGFLSSIEICVVDGGHVFEMQNWTWLLETMKMTNNVPTETRDTDFSRVRDWALDGLMRRFRQTVVFAAQRTPALMGLIRTFENHAGCMLVDEPADKPPAREAVRSLHPVRHQFRRLVVEQPADSADRRMEHFEHTALPELRNRSKQPTLVVAASYFDYLRVQDLLYRMQKEDPTFAFVAMSEYTRDKDVTRSRARLVNGQVEIALVSERYHFYWRHWIRGFARVVWYSLPANAHFYPEILNMAAEHATNTGVAPESFALFDVFDAMALERIVGAKRCRRMLRGNDGKEVYSFTN